MDELGQEVANLRAALSRVVATADAERRRIERDLHDGAQQHIVALIVGLQLARQLLDSDPAAARPLLDEMAGDAREALDRVRELAAGIYPPLLIDRGLAEALAAAASAAAVPAYVESEGLGLRFDPEVEATVYFCVREALDNAAAHAGTDTRVTIRVQADADRMAFEVVDDGVGFDPVAIEWGAGLHTLADRLGAQGGLLEIETAPGGGVRIAGRIPLGP